MIELKESKRKENVIYEKVLKDLNNACGTSAGGNSIFTGNYMMKLRRDSVGVSSATHSGVWTY